jgi:hypothetical protein
MRNEYPAGLESDLLEKVRASDTELRTSICTVRLEKVGATPVEIRPRDVGTDFEGWEINRLFGTQTLEAAIIVGMEMQARG